MAVQPNDKRRKAGAQIVRTPAPDELTTIRSPRGGSGPGQNAPQPSSINPGQASESLLGQNLRQSQVADTSEDVLSEVIAGGIAGRGDSVPADGNDQLRTVSNKMLPPAHGMKRQQDPNFFAKKS
jgi:hypothetical protein